MRALQTRFLCKSKLQWPTGSKPLFSSLGLGHGRYFSVEVNNAPIERILITGSLGQIGTELLRVLRAKYGRDSVVATDIRKAEPELMASGPFHYGDVTKETTLTRLVIEHRIDTIIHNSSILSATGEKDPEKAIRINIDGFHNIARVANMNKCRLFAPSSIAAFGPSTEPNQTPNLPVMRPTTVYGISKLYVELMGEYFMKRDGLNFRTLRYPGILSSETMPGGGTTDYAIDIFYQALLHKKYTCFLSKDTELPMMYMPDCLEATVGLLEAEESNLSVRSYNVAGCSFTPAQLAAAIQKRIPDFTIEYAPDFRQPIADSWPNSLDDSLAREDWGWKHKYDLEEMVDDMLEKIEKRIKNGDV